MSKDKMIYYRSEPIEENNVVDMTFESGADIDEFKQLCVTMAFFLGYDDETIKESFGISPTSDNYNPVVQVHHYKK